MKGAAAVLAISFLTVSPLFAQVHIKEKAIISPAQPKKVQDGLGNNHTIHFEVDWQDDPSGVAAVVSGPCGIYSWIEIWSPESIVGEDSSAVLGPDGTGTITFNIPSAHEGDYSFLVQAHFTDQTFIVMTHYKIYFDGVLVKTGDYAIDLGGALLFIPKTGLLHTSQILVSIS